MIEDERPAPKYSDTEAKGRRLTYRVRGAASGAIANPQLRHHTFSECGNRHKATAAIVALEVLRVLITHETRV